MKVLITDIHHGNGGGHVTYILSLLEGLQGECDLTLAVPETSRLYRYARRIRGVTVKPALYTSRVHSLVKEVSQLKRYLATERFDIVHVNASADHRHVMLARAALPKAPRIVWTKHNLHPVTSVGHQLRARYGTDAVIAVSNYVRDMLADTPYSQKPVHVIRHGIDTDHFKPPSDQERRAFRRNLLEAEADDVLVMGSTGGTDLAKGWLDLAAAVSLLAPADQARLAIVVAGDPPNEEAMGRLNAMQLKARVIFPGLVDDIRSVLGACDVGFVLSHRESLSYACRESLALGLPTLISNAGGLPENLTHGEQGWIVPVQDIRAISKVVRGLLANENCLVTMKANARRSSENEFRLDTFIRNTAGVYREAVGR